MKNLSISKPEILYNNAILTIENFFDKNKKLLIICFASTFILGLFAHGYGFLNTNVSHDSLKAFYFNDYERNWKIALGRFFILPYLDAIRGPMHLPWVVGFTSLIYIFITLFLVIKIFNVKSYILCVLISGIMISNITIIAQTATFLNEMDFNMFALFITVLAVFLWNRHQNILSFLGSSVLLCISVGIYQSYISMAISLIIYVCILDLLNNKDTKQVFIKGLKGFFIICCAFLIYLIVSKIIYSTAGIVPEARTNFLSISDKTDNIPLYLISFFVQTYYHFAKYFISYKAVAYSGWLMPAIVIFATVVALIIIIYVLTNKSFSVVKKLLIFVLAFLIPFAADITYFMAQGEAVHDLTTYALWFTLVFLLILSDWIAENANTFGLKHFAKSAIYILICIFIWQNIIIANTCYMKKEIESQKTFSTMTKIVHEMESFDGYVAGETPVAFISMAGSTTVVPGTEHITDIVGMAWNTSTTYYSTFDAYFEYVLNHPFNACSEETYNKLVAMDEVYLIPKYPNKGYIQMIDDIMVVKLP